VHPLSRRAAALAGALAFLAVSAGLVLGETWRGPFRIDEAHKISETAFLRLWLEGDLRSSAWFANVIDRTNPPAGKYAFGLAILLSGQELPPLPTLAVHSPDGDIPRLHPDALSAPYRQYLMPVRAASAISVALTAALLAATLTRYDGWLAALVACGLFFLHPVTTAYATTAVFDPLFALFFMACIPLVAFAAGSGTARRVAMAAALVGIVSALAFQTRLNGILAGAIAMGFLGAASGPNKRRVLAALAIALGSFAATTLAVNPFYWSTPERTSARFSTPAGLTRPMVRLAQQKEDLERLAAPLRQRRPETHSLSGRTRYATARLRSGAAGVSLLLGAAAAVTLLARRWRTRTRAIQVAVAMSLVVAMTMILTLPMPWQRYLFVVIPPLALLAGFGTAGMVRLCKEGLGSHDSALAEPER
jgi:hypothetical protein